MAHQIRYNAQDFMSNSKNNDEVDELVGNSGGASGYSSTNKFDSEGDYAASLIADTGDCGVIDTTPDLNESASIRSHISKDSKDNNTEETLEIAEPRVTSETGTTRSDANTPAPFHHQHLLERKNLLSFARFYAHEIWSTTLRGPARHQIMYLYSLNFFVKCILAHFPHDLKKGIEIRDTQQCREVQVQMERAYERFFRRELLKGRIVPREVFEVVQYFEQVRELRWKWEGTDAEDILREGENVEVEEEDDHDGGGDWEKIEDDMEEEETYDDEKEYQVVTWEEIKKLDWRNMEFPVV